MNRSGAVATAVNVPFRDESELAWYLRVVPPGWLGRSAQPREVEAEAAVYCHSEGQSWSAVPGTEQPSLCYPGHSMRFLFCISSSLTRLQLRYPITPLYIATLLTSQKTPLPAVLLSFYEYPMLRKRAYQADA